MHHTPHPSCLMHHLPSCSHPSLPHRGRRGSPSPRGRSRSPRRDHRHSDDDDDARRSRRRRRSPPRRGGMRGGPDPRALRQYTDLDAGGEADMTLDYRDL
jgi:hypothetical protein